MKKFFLVLVALAVLLISCDTGSEVIINNVADDGFSLIGSTLPFNTNSSVSIMDVSGNGLGEMDTALYVPVRYSTLENGTNDVVISFTFSEAIGSVFRISDDINSFTYNKEARGPVEEGIFFEDGNGGVTADSVVISNNKVTFTFPAGSFYFQSKYTVAFGITSDKPETYQVITTFSTYELVEESPVIEAVFLDENDNAVRAYAVDSEQVYYLHNAIEGGHIAEDTPADQFTGLSINTQTTDFGGQINSYALRRGNSGTSDDGIFDSLYELDQETENAISTQFTTDYVFSVTWPTYATNCTYNLYNGEGIQIGSHYFEINGPNAGDFIVDDTVVDGNMETTVTIDLTSYTIEEGTTFEAIPGNSWDLFENVAATDTIVDTVSPYMQGLNLTTTGTGNIAWVEENYAVASLEHEHNDAATEGHVVLFGTYDISTLDQYIIDKEDGLEFSITGSSLAASTPVTSAGSQKVITVAEVQEFITEQGYAIPADATFITSDSGTLQTTIVGSTLYVFSGFYCNFNNSPVDYTSENWTATGTVTLDCTDLSGNPLFYEDSDATVHNNGEMVIIVE